MIPNGLLAAAKAVGLLTAAVFVVAMRAYFRPGPTRTPNCVMAAAAVGTGPLHVYCVVAADAVPAITLWAALAGFGIAHALFWSAVAAHGRDRPGVVFGDAVPARLVIEGPYRVVRHPFYLAYVVGFLAASAVGGYWAQYAAAAALFVAYNAAAGREEDALARCPAFGERYTAYRRRTWRWCRVVYGDGRRGRGPPSPAGVPRPVSERATLRARRSAGGREVDGGRPACNNGGMSTLAAAPPSTAQTFRRLVAEWRAATRFAAAPSAAAGHPAYRAMIGLGPEVVPLALAALAAAPDPAWFAALSELTGADPVPLADRGRTEATAGHWLAWGRARGLV